MNPVQSIRYRPLKLNNKAVLNRWLVAGPFERRVEFEPVTMEGDVNNRWLIEGFSIHENPCRTRYAQERKKQVPPLPEFSSPTPGDLLVEDGQTKEWNLHVPWGNPRVERSGFWFVPTLLTSYAVADLECGRDHTARFTLKTCGAATFWVNEKPVSDFAPYTRNVEHSVNLEVPLKKGNNRLLIRFEDLAERDTMYYFRLDYEGPEEPAIVLPLGSVNPEEVRAAERMFAGFHFQTDTVRGDRIELRWDEPAPRDMDVNVVVGGLLNGSEERRLRIRANDRGLLLGHADDFSAGFKYFNLDASVSGVRIDRTVGVEVVPSSVCSVAVPEDIHERKKQALQCIAESGPPNMQTALAILKTGGDPARAERLLRQGLEKVNERQDCSDFELVSLFPLWRDYRHAGLFPESFWESVKRAILGYRYWIDEPGSDVMWFFSENHALMFHTCELLAGELFPEERFDNSGETGSRHREKAERRLEQWFDRFFREGLAEWNSSAYMPIDAAGWLALYEWSGSERLRVLAREALDLLYYYMAVHSLDGRMMCTYGRSYEKELKGHYGAGTSSMCWIGYGKGNINSYSISNTLLCLSGYEPPREYLPLTEPDGTGLVFRYKQGPDGFARLYMCKTREFALSSVQDFRPGQAGYQEHVVHLAFSPEAQIWVNHPGEMHPFGAGRPAWWAGNGTLPKAGQHERLAVLLFDLDEEAETGFTHAYFPTYAFDEWRVEKNWAFARKGESFAAVYAAGGLTLQETGPDRGRELRSDGRHNLWLIRVSGTDRHDSFDAFVQTMLASGPGYDPSEGMTFMDPEYGEVRFGRDQPLTVQGRSEDWQDVGVRGQLRRLP